MLIDSEHHYCGQTRGVDLEEKDRWREENHPVAKMKGGEWG